MKHLSTLLLLLVSCSISLQAQMRSESDMLRIAQHVLGHDNGIQAKHWGDDQTRSVQAELKELCRSSQFYALAGQKESVDFFRVYGYQDDRPGFVMVSTDEKACPVLGYSTTSHFSAQEMPDGLQYLLQTYALRQQEGSLTTELLTSTMQSKVKSITPLLGDIAFNQSEPYNNLCPTLYGEHCLTGCVPTAMAQIMAYHKHPKRMNDEKGDIMYRFNGDSWAQWSWAQWDVCNTEFDWNNILPTYQYKSPAPYDGSNATLSNTSQLTATVFEFSKEYSSHLCIQSLKNNGGEGFTGDIVLLICNQKGNVISVAGEKRYIENLMPGWSYNEYHIPLYASSSISDGKYRLFLASRNSGSTMWNMVKNKNGELVFMDIVKKDTQIEVNGNRIVCGYNDAQAEAIATLCGACSHSAMVDFGLDATPGRTLNAASSLVEYMDYSDRITYIRANAFTTDGWHQYLQEELQQRRPLLMAGQATNGSPGHAFVIDGYEFNSNGIPYYHVNWGWNGWENGYFLVDCLKPSLAGPDDDDADYSKDVEILSRIHPNNDDQSSNIFTIDDLIFEEKSAMERDWIDIKAINLFNCTYSTAYEIELSVWAVGEDGDAYYLDYLDTVTQLEFLNSYNYNIQGNITIPDDLPTGDYAIVLYATDYYHELPTRVIMPKQRMLHITTSYTPVKSIENESTSSSSTLYDLMGRRVNNGALHSTIVVKDGRKHLFK